MIYKRLHDLSSKDNLSLNIAIHELFCRNCYNCRSLNNLILLNFSFIYDTKNQFSFKIIKYRMICRHESVKQT